MFGPISGLLTSGLVPGTSLRVIRVRVENARKTVNDLVQLAEAQFSLDRQTVPHGPWRARLRRIIHFLSYNAILKRRATRVTRVAGFHLIVRPTVFHPRYFITSAFFATFLDGLDLSGKRVVDVGTGSGILSLAAARAGAIGVTAVDINSNAALTAAENARANGLGDRVKPVCSNLFSAFAPTALFDVIISSPPSFPVEPRDIADRAWHAGPNYRDIAPLFEQARARLAPGGCFYILLSSDSDLALLSKLIELARFQARLVAKRSLLIESLLIYALQPC